MKYFFMIVAYSEESQRRIESIFLGMTHNCERMDSYALLIGKKNLLSVNYLEAISKAHQVYNQGKLLLYLFELTWQPVRNKGRLKLIAS